MTPTIILAEKYFGEEPRHALLLNETRIAEASSDKVDELIALAEKLSVALQTRYSLMVCDTPSEYDALLTVQHNTIEH